MSSSNNSSTQSHILNSLKLIPSQTKTNSIKPNQTSTSSSSQTNELLSSSSQTSALTIPSSQTSDLLSPSSQNQKSSNIGDKDARKYNLSILNLNLETIKGVYPLMLNVNKIMSILRSENIKVTPKNSFRLLGEYVNRYNTVDETFEEKIDSQKELLQLNNNFDTIMETILLFSKSGAITPKTLINTINNLVLYYNEPNKNEIFLHYAYLAEVIYKHFSLLMSNEEIERNDFFESEIALDIKALKECAEFYYTDIYLLNSDETTELLSLLNSYYLEDILNKKSENDKAEQAAKQSAIQLEKNTEDYKKKKAAEEEAKKKADEKQKKEEFINKKEIEKEAMRKTEENAIKKSLKI